MESIVRFRLLHVICRFWALPHFRRRTFIHIFLHVYEFRFVMFCSIWFPSTSDAGGEVRPVRAACGLEYFRGVEPEIGLVWYAIVFDILLIQNLYLTLCKCGWPQLGICRQICTCVCSPVCVFEFYHFGLRSNTYFLLKLFALQVLA